MKQYTDNEGNVIYTLTKHENKILIDGIKTANEELEIMVHTAEGRETVTACDAQPARDALDALVLFEKYLTK